MMVTQNLRILFLILVSSLWCFSCSGDDPQPGCFQDEGLVIEETLTNATGTIRGPDNTFCGTGFVIEPDVKVESGPLGSFFPCNMTEEFKVDGARIIFSGYIYEGINDGNQRWESTMAINVPIFLKLPKYSFLKTDKALCF